MKPVRFYIQVRSKRAADQIESKLRALLEKLGKHTIERDYDPFAMMDIMAKESGRMAKTIAATVARSSPWVDILKPGRFPKNLATK